MLDNIDGASISDEKVRARIKGEAKFLRAYYHFLLVQGWYEVPIRKETVKDITVSSLEATPHAEALDWIIQEMEDCLDMVDDSNYDASPSHVKKNCSRRYSGSCMFVACRRTFKRWKAIL